jgi:hypothetical protein
MFPNIVKVVLAAGLLAPLVGCQTNAETGALVGGLGGAALGAGIGSVSHHRAGSGALIGGAAGAIGGGLIGASIDQQNKDRAQSYDSRDTSQSYNDPNSHRYYNSNGTQYEYQNAPSTSGNAGYDSGYRYDGSASSQPKTFSTDGCTKVTKDDVLAWAAKGTRDDVMIDRINQCDAVVPLTAADENQLRDARVSEDVIRAMKDAARRS